MFTPVNPSTLQSEGADMIYLDIKDVESIKEEDLPLLVLSSDAKSFLAWAIRRRTNSHYSHLMWLHRPGYFASQDLWYREVPIMKYDGVRLKLWRGKNWTATDKLNITARINQELAKPALDTRYDMLAIVGQLFGLVSIQVPWTKICSDWAELLKIADPFYNLKCPDPGDVNQWLNERQDQYECFARYIPD
jgi:hypothetical protein